MPDALHSLVPFEPTVEIIPPREDVYLAPADSRGRTDPDVVALWIATKKSAHTRRAYQADIEEFLRIVSVPLRRVRLEEVLRYKEQLETYRDPATHQPLAVSTIARKLSAAKSFLSFAERLGYLPFNVGAPVAAPSVPNQLAERILTEAEVHRMMALETNPRNHALLRLGYATGARVSELCGLKVRHLQPRRDRRGRETGQVTIFGKGGKTRAILVSAETWAEIQALIQDAAPDDPVFRSRKGTHHGRPTGYHLDESTALRIVRSAARRAGIPGNVSPHYLRHAHASHALDRKAPVHVVRDTLGHGSIATTNVYVHARPDESSSEFLGI